MILASLLIGHCLNLIIGEKNYSPLGLICMEIISSLLLMWEFKIN